jgi:hypothetical protein
MQRKVNDSMQRWRWEVIVELCLVLFLFGLGLFVRLYHVTEAPLDFHPTRQLRSALIARGMYYENLETVPEWQRSQAVRIWKSEGIIEPQIMERLTAWGYKLLGGEKLWLARIYSIFFWISGGVVLYLLAREIAGPVGAIATLFFFLLAPYGISASRSFQPDPLMTVLFIAFLWAVVRWTRYTAPLWAVLAGVFGGLAILVKVLVVFLLLPAWIGILLVDKGIVKTMRNPWNWLIGLLLLFPSAIYHYVGVFIVHTLQDQFSLRFFPELWTNLSFYTGWLSNIKLVFGVEYFMLGFLGVFFSRQKVVRGLLISAWVGYALLGLVFSYHIATHDYYQLPFFPIITLGIAMVVSHLVENTVDFHHWVHVGMVAVCLIGGLVYAWFGLSNIHANNFQKEVDFWTELGSSLGPDARVIAVIEDYGYPLTYWGWVRPAYWFTVSDFKLRELGGQSFDVPQLFSEQIQDKDYFLVTDWDEFNRQPMLQQLLYTQFPVLEQTPDYMIFDLHNPLQPDIALPSSP